MLEALTFAIFNTFAFSFALVLNGPGIFHSLEDARAFSLFHGL